MADTDARRRLRIAYCLDSFAIGGTELNAVRTAEALDPHRFELCVFFLRDHGPLRSRYERLKVQMTHVPIRNLYSPLTALQGIRLAWQLRRAQIDIVHSHDVYCNIFVVPWARMLSRCSVIASRRWWHDVPRRELAMVNRWSTSLAHRVLANSSALAGLLSREEGVPPAKIVEIPNFLAPSAFELVDEAACLAQRAAWGVPERAFAVGIVARLSPVKNHVLLLRAMAQLDGRFHLVVVGDGPCRADLVNRARQEGIEHRVHFVGEVVSPRNVHQFFDASVLCSLNEGFPNSVIEAMAAAKPILATPVGGVNDAVTDGVSGLVIPADDPLVLAAALRLLESDPLLRARLGAAAREVVRVKFSQERVLQSLTSLYEGLASRGAASVLGRADA